MIDEASVVRLAPKARLRFDRHAGRLMLLYPERGLLLNASAAEVLELCAEPRQVAEIVERLAAKHGGGSRAAIASDVLDLLRDLAARGLVREVAP